MKIDELIPILKSLKKDERRVMYITPKNVKVTATRTERFSDEDFAVGLLIPGRKEFYPTHIRLLFDLYIKRLSNPEGAKTIFCKIGHVFNGEDPNNFINELKDLNFRMALDEPITNLYVAQLLMIEQDFNFVYEKDITEQDSAMRKRESKFKPPRGFLMAYIRWVASGEEEIDKIIFLAVTRRPPPKRYVTPIPQQRGV